MATKDKRPVSTSEDSSLKILAKRFKAHPFIFIGTVLVLMLVIVSFVLVPAAGPSARNSSSRIFGSYNGKDIEEAQGSYFAQVRDNYVDRVRSSKQELNDQMLFRVYYEAFRSTVQHLGIVSEMENAGFTPPVSMINQEEQSSPYLLVDGKPSAARLREVSKADRMALRKSIADGIVENRFMEDNLGLRISTREKEFIKAMASPERSFDFTVLPLSSYPESEVAAYITAKPELFKQVRFSRISTGKDEGDAKKLLASVKDGKQRFEDAAKNNSKDELAAKGGDMGVLYAFEMTKEIPDEAARKAVLALGSGSLSAVVEGPNGFAFYRCEEAAKDSSTADSAVIAKARSYLKEFERGKIEDYLIAKAGEFSKQAVTDGFDKACKASSLELLSFGPVALNYGDVPLFSTIASANQKALSGASTSENFLKTAFSTPIGEIAKPIVLGDNIIVLKVKEERNAEENTLSTIDLYYSSYVGQAAEQRIQNYFLASGQLKDNFIKVYSEQIQRN